MNRLSIIAAFPFLMSSVQPADVWIKPDQPPKLDSGECGDDLVYSYDNASNTLTITGTGAMWDYEIYAAPWFFLNEDIEHVIIDDAVDHIGNYAFYSCYFIEDIAFPDSLKSIGDHAFEECGYLQQLSLPDGLTEIGDSAFQYDCFSDITLPDTVQTLGANAFSNNDELLSVKLPDSIRSIGTECFADCVYLSDIRIPDTVTEIGEDILERDAAWFHRQKEPFVIFGDGYLYRYFGDETEIEIPDTVKKIGRHCFTEQVYRYGGNWEPFYVRHNTRTDIRSVTMPDTVTELAENAFSRMTGLEEIQFSKNLSRIPKELCCDCTALNHADLPDGLTEIGENAFSRCLSLETIKVPDSVETIGKGAFTDNAWLKNAGDFVILGDSLLYQYQGIRKVITVPEGVKTICSGAFSSSNAVSVTLPGTVRTLCPDSFSSASLTDLTLNDGLTALPQNAVSVSQYFSHITIPESVTDIDPKAIICSEPITVIGSTGSAAEQYAKQSGNRFREELPQPDGPDLTMDPVKDGWSFANSMTVFGGRFYLSEEDLALLEALNFTPEPDWGGSCFGMCVAAILARNGIFSANQIDREAAFLCDVQPTEAVQSMINYYQSTYTIAAFRAYRRYERISQRVYRMISSAQNIRHGETPFLICFETESGGLHAVVACGCEHGSWEYDGREWTDRIVLYDPNKVGFYDERCLYYDAETFAFSIPHYSFSYSGTDTSDQMFFSVCDDLDLINSYPYPFSERFGTPAGNGDVSGDGTVSADDAALLQKWLLRVPGASLPVWQSADQDGNGTVNAKDLTLLRRMILEQA